MFQHAAAGLKAFGAATLRAVPGLTREVAGLAAIGLISYGAWQVYAPAGFVTAGVLLLGLVLFVPRR